MKKSEKIIQAIITVIMILSLLNILNIFNSNVYAVQTRDEGYSQDGADKLKEQIDYDKAEQRGELSSSKILSEGKDFIDKGSSETPIQWSEIKKNILPIAHMLVGIATVVFVIVGMIMGIKYMISGADERAGIKQKLIWLIVSMVLVYGATGIYNLVVDIMQNITK